MNKDTRKIIEAGWRIGYSATITPSNGHGVQVIGIAEDSIYCRRGDGEVKGIINKLVNHPNVKIIGWKYVGELAGNEKIPVGMKFRGRETGKIYTYESNITHELMRLNDGKRICKVYRNEAEPVFT